MNLHVDKESRCCGTLPTGRHASRSVQTSALLQEVRQSRGDDVLVYLVGNKAAIA